FVDFGLFVGVEGHVAIGGEDPLDESAKEEDEDAEVDDDDAEAALVLFDADDAAAGDVDGEDREEQIDAGQGYGDDVEHVVDDEHRVEVPLYGVVEAVVHLVEGPKKDHDEKQHKQHARQAIAGENVEYS